MLMNMNTPKCYIKLVIVRAYTRFTRYTMSMLICDVIRQSNIPLPKNIMLKTFYMRQEFDQ